MSSLKEVEKKRRTVFKPLLDNPFPQTKFPHIDPAKQAEIVEFLLLILDEIHKYNQACTKKFTPVKPKCMENLTMGFNSTVKVLEAQARAKYKGKKLVERPLKYVFVCKPDIQPALITQHIPTLCFTASTDEKVKLIQLPRNTISRIEERLGKKTGIIGMYHYDGLSPKLVELLNEVDDVKAEWLENLQFRDPKIKMLETSAPIKSKLPKNKVEKK